MNTFERITNARELLELNERATMKEIKTNFRRLIKAWHPDKNPDDAYNRLEMTRRITDAYHTLLSYCANYQFAFTRDEISRYLPEDEWWHERFGHMMK